MYTTKEVLSAIENSWSAYTAYDASDWSEDNPARGQCVVSSLIIQDILGGTLQKTRTSLNGCLESHYRNILPDGTILDSTRSQYIDTQELVPSPINLGNFASLREKLFSQANTEKRYKLLRASVLINLT